MGLFILLIVPTMLLGLWAQHRVSSTYNKWKRVPTRSRITGAEAASAVMRNAGIYDVDIVEISGHLTDHYDPAHKRLALSSENYRGNSLAAVGVAAHEAGHAIQHKVGYKALEMRMSLNGITGIASKVLPFMIFGSLFLPFLAANMVGIKVAIICYAIIALFQFITLPVEFDASKRARVQLANLGIVGQDELPGVVKTLNAAGFTYVAAFVLTLANLLYWVAVSRR
ncbi:zinc metallopeptidase [Cerasicoccus arenae]|uniref:Zinc metallopeptidase n=1 Tax=Cerasicoccus arenae TaxID=424488 RepID=A0A8J3GDP5_9BACT|nr:zinc metallopeptidase [Cerasicoccus arenae]MBK1860048.1 zinc metallopeptidase [Cerasicoccus arenae]GHB93227.1 zinc metallopeptidase [Cerasicoccus arenae]